MIDAKTVAELRRRTGAGMMDAKRALEESNGNMDKAIEALRTKGLAKASSKQSRVAEQGLVTAYTHGGRIGAMIELNCETDFVARGEDFKALAQELAMHVAAATPLYLSPEDVPAETVDQERRLALEEARNSGKPEGVLQQIADGRVEKFFAENCLLRQGFIKDPGKTIEELIAETSGRLGEKIALRRFARFELGRE